jgi:uncharacterized protein DUF4258
MLPQKLDRNRARKLVSEVAARYPANIRFSRHALEEMGMDNLTTGDVLNIIKSPSAKIIEEPELERGSFRYRLRTNNITVVLAFDSKTSFVVITAWRKS